MKNRNYLKPWLRNKPVWFIKLLVVLVHGSLLTWAVPITFILSAFSDYHFIDVYKDLYSEFKEWLKWQGD